MILEVGLEQGYPLVPRFLGLLGNWGKKASTMPGAGFPHDPKKAEMPRVSESRSEVEEA